MSILRVEHHHYIHLADDVLAFLKRTEAHMATFVEQITQSLNTLNGHVDTLNTVIVNNNAELSGLSAIIADLRTQLQNVTGLDPATQTSLLGLVQQADDKVVAMKDALVAADAANAPA